MSRRNQKEAQVANQTTETKPADNAEQSNEQNNAGVEQQGAGAGETIEGTDLQNKDAADTGLQVQDQPQDPVKAPEALTPEEGPTDPVAEDSTGDEAEADPAEPEVELSAVDKMIEAGFASESTVLNAISNTFKSYLAVMGRSKGTDAGTLVEQQMQLWAMLRMVVNDQTVFRDAMQFILSVMRENPDGAFDLPMLMRGVDTPLSRLNADHREAYRRISTLLSTAAGMNNPKEVSSLIDLGAAMKSEIFTPNARQRIIGFFSK